MGTKLIDWLFGIIARPVATLNEIAREKPVGWGLLVYTSITLLSGSAALFDPATYRTYEEITYQLAISIPPIVMLVGGLFFAIVTLFIFSLVLQLFARLFGGRAGYWNLFSAYTFTSFPGIITVPITLIGGFLGIFGSILSGLAAFGISIWVLVLQVIAVRESHGLSTGMSILAYIITLVILVILPIILVAGLIFAFI